MKVIVVGGGVAGLSVAKALTRLPLIASVKIIDNAATDDRRLIDNTYTGLWNPSLSILSKYGVDIEKNICYVKKSGYRSTDGRWLAQPRKGLGIDYHKEPCLGFIKDKDLLTALVSSLPSSVSFINESISIVEMNNKVISNTGNIYEADLIIAADGKNSTIRRCLHNDNNNTLKYRGYEVYRGHSTSLFHFAYKHRISEEAFQTWGPGLRFATVPTYEGNAWFLAISKPIANANTIKGAHSVINKENFEDLVAMLSNWHNPIPDLLANTDNGHKGVIVCDAYGGSSTKLPQSVVSNNNTGAAFVGDASYCLDPILAQGAGLSIEHSYLLAKALEQHKYTNNLGKALKYFDEMKVERQSRLHYLSDISQSIGNLHDKNMIQARDNIMALLYENNKDTIGFCFDKVIQFSSSNRFL